MVPVSINFITKQCVKYRNVRPPSRRSEDSRSGCMRSR